MKDLSYEQSGVNTVEAAKSVTRFSDLLRKTFQFHSGVGKVLLDLGYYANVIDLGNNLGLAISTDGVGTKILVAQAMDKYDTVGIDCVAMNANDLICVGATPLSLVDYIAVEVANSEFIYELMKGLYAGAEQANVSIPAGEIAQVRELIHGSREGKAFDLVATCVGTVPSDKILVGKTIQPGDVVVGVRSSGIHSNGYTLARNVLLNSGKYTLHGKSDDLARTIGEELLEPTMIYVKPAVELLNGSIDVKAMAHITGDGLMNLARVDSETGYIVDQLPEPQPIFQLIQREGDISDEEMYTVFNMGIGLCVVVSPDDADKTIETFTRHSFSASVIGKTVHDPEKKVTLTQKNLIGAGGVFHHGA